MHILSIVLVILSVCSVVVSGKLIEIVGRCTLKTTMILLARSVNFSNLENGEAVQSCNKECIAREKGNVRVCCRNHLALYGGSCKEEKAYCNYNSS